MGYTDIYCLLYTSGRYTEDMRDNIAKALDLEKNRINIKGTTTERLGFVGREEGIAAEAVCSICR